MNIRTERASDIASREALLDKAFGKTRVRKTSARCACGASSQAPPEHHCCWDRWLLIAAIRTRALDGS
jgi:hypothetical protein